MAPQHSTHALFLETIAMNSRLHGSEHDSARLQSSNGRERSLSFIGLAVFISFDIYLLDIYSVMTFCDRKPMGGSSVDSDVGVSCIFLNYKSIINTNRMLECNFCAVIFGLTVV